MKYICSKWGDEKYIVIFFNVWIYDFFGCKIYLGSCFIGFSLFVV